MGKDYIKIQNQGSILKNLMLLNEMNNSVGYADEEGYFTKKGIAEIGIKSFIITSGGQVGLDIIDRVNDLEIETNNPILQQAKMRMQILRLLGFVATDYDSELYTITDFGKKALERAFPYSQDCIPDYSLVLEAFLGITTSSEIYNHNCSPNFNCYIGYNVLFALENLDYMIAVDEMPLLTTYSTKNIKEFVCEAKKLRESGQSFTDKHDHYPKKHNGEPVAKSTLGNLTRSINQILRLCEIIEQKSRYINGIHYYVCTQKGRDYVKKVMKRYSKYDFITPFEFRRERAIKQKRICVQGYNNILKRGGYEVNVTDKNIVFSPYQLIPEKDADVLMDITPRKVPAKKEDQLQAVTENILGTEYHIKPNYLSQEDYINYIKSNVGGKNIIQEILCEKENVASGYSDDTRRANLIKELTERHKYADKSLFYPFVHSLFNAMGLECRGEVGRIDGYFEYNGKVIPAEIKSFSESKAYNLKGARQAIENKIMLYKEPQDLNYASMLIGFSHPENDTDIKKIMDAAFEEWGIKLLTFDLRTIVTMCVDSIWDEKKVNFDEILSRYGMVRF